MGRDEDVDAGVCVAVAVAVAVEVEVEVEVDVDGEGQYLSSTEVGKYNKNIMGMEGGRDGVMEGMDGYGF